MRIAVIIASLTWAAMVSGTAAREDYRLFTDRQGKTTVARIVRADERHVTLVDSKDREFTVDQDRFLPEDRAYIDRWVRRSPDAARKAPLVEFLELQGYKPARFRVEPNGHVMIPIRANRKVLRFLLDTGVSRSALDAQAAQYLDVKVHDGNGEVSALAGSVKARSAVLAEIELGGLRLRNVDVNVFDLNRRRVLVDREHKPVDGLLGADILKRLGALVDYGNRTLFVGEDAAASTTALHAFLKHHRYEHADFKVWDSGHLELPAKVNGEALAFVLDTGASRSVLDAGVVELLSLPVTETRTRAYGIDVDAGALRIARLQSLEIGPVALHIRNLFCIDLNPRVDGDRPIIHGLVGGDVLTLFSGIIDYRSRRLYLKTKGGVEGS